MGINLKKGQKVSLSKEAAGISKILVGLGWDPIKQESKGFLGGLFGGGSADIDCDASAIMLDQNSNLRNKDNVIYFGNLSSTSGSVRHLGDNLTGDGDGDDEQLTVDLEKVPTDISKIIFVVNIYDCVKRNQHFGQIQNAFIRIVDSSNNKEILKYNLSESYSNKTALIVGELYKHENEWKFAAIGEGTNDASLTEVVNRYR